MKENTCCFTGHRSIPSDDLSRLSDELDRRIELLYNEGITDFCAGGALGFDTLAAERVMEFRKKHGDVRLILFLPCPEQASRWSFQNKRIYEQILASADEVEYACDRYTDFCMGKRNQMLVNASTVCLAYLQKPRGGTAYTVRYAKSRGVRVINLAESSKEPHQNPTFENLKFDI